MTALLPAAAVALLWLGYEWGHHDAQRRQARHEAMQRHPTTWHQRNEA